MKLVFLHGLPGVGKLTVAREPAQVTGLKLFHNHLAVDLVEAVFEFGTPQFVELREMIWLAVFRKAAESNLAGLIFTFAYDRTVRRSFIGDVQTIVESNDGEVLFVELKCSREEVERRLTDPSRKRFGKLNSLEQFRELSEAGAFVDQGFPSDRLVVDTTELPAGEAAQFICSKLGLQMVP